MDGNRSAGRLSNGEEQRGRGSSADFTAPLGSRSEGRLVFASVADTLALSGDTALTELYHAHFEGEIPGIGVEDGIVTIQYRHMLGLGWLLPWRHSSARVTLNSSIAWEIEFRGGIAKLDADLRALQLRSLDLGSASQVEIALPRPAGVCYVHFSGSAADVVIHRPLGVAVRFQLNGAATRLALDEHYLGAVGDGVAWQSNGYRDDADRCEISIAGSVSKFTVDTL